VRLTGGLLYLSGMVIMAWNVAMTVTGGKPVDVPVLRAPAHA
jgi:cytochrome c oxidase cbb3-type subunit 1